jgi:hypothetical protein
MIIGRMVVVVAVGHTHIVVVAVDKLNHSGYAGPWTRFSPRISRWASFR